jgi:hypothetical protein
MRTVSSLPAPATGPVTAVVASASKASTIVMDSARTRSFMGAFTSRSKSGANEGVDLRGAASLRAGTRDAGPYELVGPLSELLHHL